MTNDEKIRTSQEFKEIINYIRAKCILNGIVCPSINEITKKIAINIDKEKLWQNEFCKK